MLILIVVSVIAAVMFHRKTAEKGYHSPRFWMYPLIVGNGLLLFAIAAKWITKQFVPDATTPLLTIYGPIVDLLTLVGFFMLIGKAWRQIQQLPPFE